MKMKFYAEQQPASRPIGGWLLSSTEPWDCYWTYKDQWRHFHSPISVIWDGASIPRFGWSVIGLTPGGRMCGPSLAHDIPYRSKGGRFADKMQGCTLTDENGRAVTIDRKEADIVLREAMRFFGISRRQCALVYATVRIFGRQPHWGGPMPRG